MRQLKISNLNLNNFVELIGIDQSSKMLQIAKQKNKGSKNKYLKISLIKKDLTRIYSLKK